MSAIDLRLTRSQNRCRNTACYRDHTTRRLLEPARGSLVSVALRPRRLELIVRIPTGRAPQCRVQSLAALDAVGHTRGAMDTYCKLYSSIITSTIWCEDHATRIVWISMLALKDRDGFVAGSVPGFAAVARVSIEEMRAAVAKLSSPDPDSNCQDFEGRRIERVDGGWLILNHEKYRDKPDAERRKEQMREASRRYRERASSKKIMTDDDAVMTDDDFDDNHQASSHTDTDTKTDTDLTTTPTPLSACADSRPQKRDDILAVFAHYRQRHPRSHPSPASKSREWRAIKARLDEGHSVEQLCEAIDGMHRTPHNLGDNERGQKYLALELCMRSASQVQRFAEAPAQARRETHDERVMRELAEHNARCDAERCDIYDSALGHEPYLIAGQRDTS